MRESATPAGCHNSTRKAPTLRGCFSVSKGGGAKPIANYPDFIKNTGYGDVRGLCGANCRHSFGPYIEGVSPETYTGDELDKLASKTVKYNGKEIPFYDATQMQRKLERKAREWKRRQKTREAAGLDSSSERKRVRECQAMLKEFTDQTGLERDYSRERIGKG